MRKWTLLDGKCSIFSFLNISISSKCLLHLFIKYLLKHKRFLRIGSIKGPFFWNACKKLFVCCFKKKICSQRKYFIYCRYTAILQLPQKQLNSVNESFEFKRYLWPVIPLHSMNLKKTEFVVCHSLQVFL